MKEGLGYELERDIVYHDDHDHPKLQLDLYLPQDQQTPCEVVLFAHGGGWKRGDRKREYFGRPNINEKLGRALAKKGVAVAVINYRLSSTTKLFKLIMSFCLSSFFGTCAALLLSFLLLLFSSFCTVVRSSEGLSFETFTDDVRAHKDLFLNFLVVLVPVFYCVILYIFIYFEQDHQPDNVKHPEHVQDICYALSWIVNNAHKYNIDPDKVFLAGHSAGGHLALLLALNPKHIEDCGLDVDIIKSVKGVITLSGVFNLGRLKKNIITRSWYLHPVFGHDEIIWREASPLTYANAKFDYPFLLLNAQVDFHLQRDTQEIKKVLLEHDNTVFSHVVNRTTHRSILADCDSPRDKVSDMILEFIKSGKVSVN